MLPRALRGIFEEELKMARQSGLGRGLDALFADSITLNENEDRTVRRVKITEIEPDKNQPRKIFDEEKLSELADSIKENGVITPLIVRKEENGRYKLIAGERRWRAARRAGLDEVDVYIREIDDATADLYALVENLQRVDLNPLEEANGYKLLMEKYHLTQESVAEQVGKSRPAVTNSLRLLSLPVEIMPMLENGTLSAGQARTLLGYDDEEVMIRAAREAAVKKLSVREMEKALKSYKSSKDKPKNKIKPINCDIKAVEAELSERLGRRVAITGGSKGGILSIQFYGDDDLNDLIEKISYGFK
jgi:ParB family chromosome partitioning protein